MNQKQLEIVKQGCSLCSSDNGLMQCLECTTLLCVECYLKLGGNDGESLCPSCQMICSFKEVQEMKQIEICEACADIHSTKEESIQCLKDTIKLINTKVEQYEQLQLKRKERIQKLKNWIQINQLEILSLKSCLIESQQ